MGEREKNNYEPIEKGNEINLPEVAHSRIFEAKRNPNILVKKIRGQLDEIEEDYKLGRDNFGDLFPDNQLVIAGKNREMAIAYILMSRVYEVALTPENGKVVLEQLDSIVAKIVGIYLANLATDQYGSRRGIAPDIYPKNMIFGKTAHSPEPRWYCVDNYPLLFPEPDSMRDMVNELIKDYSGFYNFPKITEIIDKLRHLS
ncbi:MAG: hypothetical protein Q8R08_01225 [bacterium]|nr:hypothetical protein [bacterium]